MNTTINLRATQKSDEILALMSNFRFLKEGPIPRSSVSYMKNKTQVKLRSSEARDTQAIPSSRLTTATTFNFNHFTAPLHLRVRSEVRSCRIHWAESIAILKRSLKRHKTSDITIPCEVTYVPNQQAHQ